MIRTQIRYSERHPHLLAVCDGKCEKAFGTNGRPCVRSDADVDDVYWLADSEVGDAPADPGSYEGGHGKPFRPKRHNKWCVRECERSALIDPGKPIRCPDYASRQFNMPWLHALEDNAHLSTDEIFTPME